MTAASINGPYTPSSVISVQGSLVSTTGATGPKGDTGAVGPIGPKGDPGAPGQAGVQGPAGIQGLPGVAGAQGPIGPQGAQGLQGEIGPQGLAGATGATGSGVLNGPTGPTAGNGNPGDFWLDTNSKILYGPKGATAWPESGVLLAGATGASGATGAAGATGAPGATGATGAPGANGSVGAQGQQGPTGPNIVSNSTTTNLTGLLKGTGSAVTTAEAGTDYLTSIGLTAPSIFSVTGSPLTANGSLTLGLATQAPNTVLAGPASGADAQPSFRKLGSSDLSPQWYAAAAGTGDVNTVDLTPAATSLATGLEVNFMPIAANTQVAPTLDVNGLGAKTIVKLGGAPLQANDLTTGAIAKVIYDGVNWQLQNPQTSANGTVTNVTASAPLSVATGSSTPVISIPQASGSASGYLSSSDWTTFNNKGTVTSVGVTAPITNTGTASAPVIAIPQASGSVAGYLSPTDWSTFNSKGNGTVTNVTASGPLSVATGTTTPAISIQQAASGTNGYLSSTDWNTFNNKGSGTVTDVTASAPLSSTGGTTPQISLSNSGVTAGTYHSANATITVDATGRITAVTTFAYKIGDMGPGGGYIFFVDKEDQYPTFTYLEVSPNLGNDVWCDNVSTSIAGASGWDANAVGRGQDNTTAMLGICSSGAANLANAYSSPNGTNDWFLPSEGELMLMYTNMRQVGVGNFVSDYHWSSTQYDTSAAWTRHSYFGNISSLLKSVPAHVRAVRAF